MCVNNCLRFLYREIFFRPVSSWDFSGGFMKRGGDWEAGGGGRADQNKKSFRSDLARRGQEGGNNTLFLSCSSPSLPFSALFSHLHMTRSPSVHSQCADQSPGFDLAGSCWGHQGCRKIEAKGRLKHLQSQSHVSVSPLNEVHLPSGLLPLRVSVTPWSKNGFCH